MIIKLSSKMNCNVKCLLLLTIFSLQFFSAQTAPKISRFFQLNSAKGSMLKAVETTENHIYHVGSANGELGFDGYNKEIQGKDEVFVLKSNVSDGSNVWMTTLNSATNTIIDVKYTYVDGDDNIYVAGNFYGSITIGSQTISSDVGLGLQNGFILKIDANGAGKWVNILPQLSEISTSKFKMAADADDLFVVYNRNHLLRINKPSGEILYDQTLNNQLYLSSVIVKDNNLYISGFSYVYENTVIGTETIMYRSGFILKGDKQGDFTASLQTKSPINGSGDVSDMAFDSEGKLIFTGFTLNSVQLVSETGTFSYTFNPNATFSANSNYYYTAKIDANLETIDYFRTSSSLVYSGTHVFMDGRLSLKIVPYGNLGNYRIIAKINNILQNSFTNPDGSVTYSVQGDPSPMSFLISCNNAGISTGGARPMYPGRIMNANSNLILVSYLNYRLFRTFAMQIDNGGFKWTKEKTNSVGGILQIPYLEHLNSDKNESFFSTLVEGNGNFFGKKVTNSQYVNSRYIARIGTDGIPKWTARFHVDGAKSEMNSSKQTSKVDKDDNLFFLANTSGNSSAFVDASGQATDFQQANNLSSKVLIKIDKNGNTLWSKQFVNSSDITYNKAVLSVDNNGDVYVAGLIQNGTVNIDQNILGSTTALHSNYVIKFNGVSGNIVFAKTYDKIKSEILVPSFDTENNLYLFVYAVRQDENFDFDGVVIPTAYGNNNLMLKFNSSGNVVWGKNFYANSINYESSNISQAKFDGTDFIVRGSYSAPYGSDNFTGLDLVDFPNEYLSNEASYIAKIKIDGSVVWQKPIYHTNPTYISDMDLDDQKNIYHARNIAGKLKFDGIEYNFDQYFGEKIIQKFDTNGNLKYNMTVDRNIYNYHQIDVLKDDTFNVLSATIESKIFNYPVNNNNSSNFFIATFGNLDQKYLTPTKDYLALTAIEMENNPDNANTFSFDLVNNTDWNAASDQPWLNLSFLSLVEKNNFKNSISGNGDAKIIISADTNNSGANRSGSILLNGTGVNSKTIIVTQTLILSTGEAKTVVTTLYPNPTSDILNIETKQTISKIEIFDLSGKLLKTENGKDKKVSVSNLTKGMYLIKLYTENGVINSKFIKK